MKRTMVVVFSLVAVFSTTSCESDQCKQMKACCAAIADQDWVGDACGAISQNVHEPRSCSAIVSAIQAAAEDRKIELAAVCTP